jgi:hypothetical protein
VKVYVANDCADAGDLAECVMTPTEWDGIELISQWLSVFRQATHEMSTTKRPMLSQTHAIFRSLQEEIKTIIRQLPDNADDNLKQGLIDAHMKLSHYFHLFDQSDYCMWASRVYSMLLGRPCKPNFFVQF